MACIPVSVDFERGEGEESRERDDVESVMCSNLNMCGNMCHNLSLHLDSAQIEFL